jgi:hypothetical protein
MANITCTWKVELDGVNLYDDRSTLLVNFIPMVVEVGDPELSTEEPCEWDGENIAYRWYGGVMSITYRE